MVAQIADYALIGNCETAALVSGAGSIDWLCMPRFDDASFFTRLLGERDHGHWSINPEGNARSSRRYRDGTLVLAAVAADPTGPGPGSPPWSTSWCLGPASRRWSASWKGMRAASGSKPNW